ncbi:thiamine-phosphate synthase family protein [Thermococcus sp.]|uniref:thiamine-phosphate synthase family protein n=1 Tax=Thermococcus sp. TaxID=35749 RepID=UPI0026315047|nr:thiamine-phosphate synthase family protein [Thermococcus sp.]
MRTPSVYIAEELMPYLRARIAEALYRTGFKQAKIASYLGITQAMVSKYLAGKYRTPPEGVSKLLDAVADEISRLIVAGSSKEEVLLLLSRRLYELFMAGEVCRHYSSYAGVSEGLCRELVPPFPRSAVLDELEVALRELLSLKGFSSLVPEVRSNFAYAPANARKPEDVAAVPGRITLVKGRPYALPPEFGASAFTASLVVEVMRRRPSIRSVLNIRYGDDIEHALGKAGFSFTRVRTGGLSERRAVEEIAGAFEEAEWDAVVDEGGAGVEPLVYIFGRNPLDVVGKVKRLLEVM